MLTVQANGNLVIVGSKDWGQAEKDAFLASGASISIKINGQAIKHIKAKVFSTGSCGWNMTGKVLVAEAAEQAAA